MADSIQQVLEKIRRGSGSLAKLTRVWARRDSVWDQSVGAYRLAARSALDLGEGFLAFNIASAGLAVFVDDLRLLQLKALALARTGSPEAANTVLRRLASAGGPNAFGAMPRVVSSGVQGNGRLLFRHQCCRYGINVGACPRGSALGGNGSVHL